MAKKPKSKTSKHDDFVKLYQSDDAAGSVDMTTLERANRKKRFAVVLFMVVLVLSGVAVALGYVVFSDNRLSVNPSEVTVAVTAPATVASGDELKLTMTYQNTSPVAIARGSV